MLDVSNHMIQGRVVGQDKILIDREVEPVPNIGHDFGLFDGVNTQFTFEVLVKFHKVCRIASMIDNDLNNDAYHSFIADRSCCCRCW